MILSTYCHLSFGVESLFHPNKSLKALQELFVILCTYNNLIQNEDEILKYDNSATKAVPILLVNLQLLRTG